MDKDTLYNFLVRLDEAYGTSDMYFREHPSNEGQIAFSKYDQHVYKTGLRVVKCGKVKESDNHFLGTYYNVDQIPLLKYDGRHLVVIHKETGKEIALDDPMHKVTFELWYDSHMPVNALHSDVITLGDMSFTLFDIAVGIEKYVETHRLGRMAIYDRYVSIPSKGALSISSTEKYTEEFCDEIEQLATDINPYIKQGALVHEVFTDDDKLISWDDVISGKCGNVSRKNTLWLATFLPTDIKDKLTDSNDHTYKKNLFNVMLYNMDIFSGIITAKSLTEKNIMFKANDEPLYNEVIKKLSSSLREIRQL